MAGRFQKNTLQGHRFKGLRVSSAGAYIACGRLTGYWEAKLRPWDVAAGILLVEEAGGRVSDLTGGTLRLDNFISIVASNNLIHDELVGDLGYAG
ncbi:MAG: hypothetical protein M1130_11720 [Actinobacteria bacterium]|nr:hypothetical protein [Actinomycetota bacterium]